jgi:uncharacterized protein YbbC (DUF1343 family)/CubicO group peptidase (beta-lactamase class C family)
MTNIEDILVSALMKAVTEAKAPGAVAYVGQGNDTLFWGAAGSRQIEPVTEPANKDTIYDLASLTKVVATTTAILQLREQNLLDLDTPAFKYLPIPGFDRFTLRHLLTHTSGLTSGRPYYKECTTLLEMLQRYADGGIDWEPGSRRRYSDVGFMILGQVVEMVAKQPLELYCAEHIFSPLKMENTRFKPPVEWIDRCAATEVCPWRDKLVIGEVHDENAYAVGGVAGHAGLFSTAEDLATFCRALMDGKILSHSTVDEMCKLGAVPIFPWQGHGWLLDPWSSEGQGFLPSRTAIGHTGWTGTSVWMDRETKIFCILLSNTCHPSRLHRDNRSLRSIFYEAVADILYPKHSAVHTGLDWALRNDFETIAGKRIALLTNDAATDQLGRPILDVLAMNQTINLACIYTPEHGLRRTAEAGEIVTTETSKVPVVSLYGKRREPSADELAEIDLFVVDLQDVGSRYYTYIATMKDCLSACGKAKKPVLILDRPNPVGGTIIEGPVAEKSDSLVSWGPVPVRHGLTIGEAAHFICDHVIAKPTPKILVHRADNWRRRFLFDACSLSWIAPSPNMTTPATTILYVGNCLFEGTNISEGRGTETPFEIIGAPWFDPGAILGKLNPADTLGCTLEPIEFTPRAIPGKASSPKYKDETCKGLRFRIDEPEHIRPFRLAVAILCAVRRTQNDKFKWLESFDTLAGTIALRQMIEGGKSVDQMTDMWMKAHAAFRKQRTLLYS